MWHTVAFIVMMTLAHAGFTQQPPARPKPPMDPAVKRDGWWIRVNPEPKTETIVLQITGAEGGTQKTANVSWTRSNDPNNFDLPESVRLLEGVTLTVTTRPADAKASLCVFYAANGVKLVPLPAKGPLALTSSTRDKGCLP